MRIKVMKELNERGNRRRIVVLHRNGARSRHGFMIRAKSASLLGLRKPGRYIVRVERVRVIA